MTHADRTPASLLERVRRTDDTRSWDEFVDRYAPLLLTWVRRLGVPSKDQPDVVQDIFAIMVQELPRFQYDPQRRFRGFLFTITRNRIADRKLLREAEGGFLPERACPDDLQALIDEDYKRHLGLQMERILASDFDDRTARIFRRYVIDEVPPADVATECGVTLPSVYQARTRVIRRFREELAGLFD